MSASSEFFLAVKSTWDKIMVDLTDDVRSQYPDGINCADLDDVTLAKEVMANLQPAILWQFPEMIPTPVDPLYTATFFAGVKTSNDAGNYEMGGLLTHVNTLFQQGVVHDVRDYSEHPVSDIKGSIYIVGAATVPQSFDRQSGLRMVKVMAKITRYGDCE